MEWKNKHQALVTRNCRAASKKNETPKSETVNILADNKIQVPQCLDIFVIHCALLAILRRLKSLFLSVPH